MTSYERHLDLRQEQHAAAILAQNDDPTPAIERAGAEYARTVAPNTALRASDFVHARRIVAAALDVEEIAKVIDDHSPEWRYTRIGDPKGVWCYGCDGELDINVDGAEHQAAAVRDHLLGTSS